MAHAAAELSELQNCASALSDWCSNEVLRRVLTDVANELRDKGVLDEEESFIDATFAMAKGPFSRSRRSAILQSVHRPG